MTDQQRRYRAGAPAPEADSQKDHAQAYFAEALTAIEELRELFEKENSRLRDGRGEGPAAYQVRKEELGEALRGLTTKLFEAPDFLQGHDNPRRTVLIERVEALRKLTGENRMLLNAAKVATFRRIEAVVQARRRLIENCRPYGRSGEIEELFSGAPLSVAAGRKI